MSFEEIFGVFKSFFGDNFVDSGRDPNTNNMNYILVYFPHVTIRNEYDQSTELYNLFVKVYIFDDGRLNGSFLIKRTTFTFAQALSRYTHSHVSPSYFGQWSNPCLGRGPLVRLTSELSYNRCDESIWLLFCREISEYVQVESIEGGPYIRLDSIGSRSGFIFNTDINCTQYMYAWTILPNFYNANDGFKLTGNEVIKRAFKDNIFKFKYYNNQYIVADSDIDFCIKISQLFTTLMKEHDIPDSAFNEYKRRRCILDNGRLLVYDQIANYNNSTLYEPVIFKGRTFAHTVIGDTIDPSTVNTIFILSIDYIAKLYCSINILVNTLYNKNYENDRMPKIF